MTSSPYYVLLLLYAFFLGTVVVSNIVALIVTALVKRFTPSTPKTYVF